MLPANCYHSDVPLFINGDVSHSSIMYMYAILPLIHQLHQVSISQVWYADDR